MSQTQSAYRDEYVDILDPFDNCPYCHGEGKEKDGTYCRIPRHGLLNAEAEAYANEHP